MINDCFLIIDLKQKIIAFDHLGYGNRENPLTKPWLHPCALMAVESLKQSTLHAQIMHKQYLCTTFSFEGSETVKKSHRLHQKSLEYKLNIFYKFL